jgi:hypothetical protein
MSKSTRVRRRSTDHLEIHVRPERSPFARIVLFLWRWRWEIATVLVLLTVYEKLVQHVTERQAVALMAAPVVVVFALPWIRRFVIARFWCAVSRHRVRACFVQMRVLNWDGRLPLILLVRPTNVGERVWLWMRPGLSVVDLENRTEHIAAACFAREARLQRSRRWAVVVRLDVVRRDPLVSTRPIPSPLVDATATVPTQREPESPLLAQIGARPLPQPPETPTPDLVGGDSSDGSTGKPTKAHPGRKSGPVSLNGEDVSDYV